jgi:ribosomal protein L11
MKYTVNTVLLLLILFALPAGSADAAMAKTYRVQLATRDAQQVGALACAGIASGAAERLEASTLRRGSAQVSVEVQCKSHRVEGATPVAHRTTCSNRTGQWQCEPGVDAMLMTLRPQQVVAVIPDGINAPVAITLVTEANKLTVPPFQNPASWLMVDTCKVSKGAQQEFKGAAHFSIDCTGGRLAITRDCWGEKCRYFITAGEKRIE